MMTEAFLIGLVAGFIFYEITGLTAGGIIAPAYFAVYLHSPLRIVSTLFVALAVWAVLEMLTRYFIIYGRRRLIIAIILGFCAKIAFDAGLHISNITYLDMSAIGYIIPGLIANETSRQKILPTIASIVIVTAITYLIMLLFR